MNPLLVYYFALLMAALNAYVQLLVNGQFDSPITPGADGGSIVPGYWFSTGYPGSGTAWVASGGYARANTIGPNALFQDVYLAAGTYQLVTVASFTGELGLIIEKSLAMPQVFYYNGGVTPGTHAVTFTLPAPTTVRINYNAGGTSTVAIDSATLYRL